MRRVCLVLILLFGLASGATAQDKAWTVGDRVLANFQKKGRWYPAVVVESLNGDVPAYKVVYQDGFVEKRRAKGLRPDSMRAGSKVEAPLKRVYQPGTVEVRLGNAALIVFADKTKQWNGVGRVGIKAENLTDLKGDPPGGGQPVLATWKDDTAWHFPGQVVTTGDKGKFVIFEDGSASWRTDAQIKTSLPKAGDTVQIKLPGEKTWSDVTLRTIIGGFAVRVVKADKKMVWTALSRIRVAAK
jgi:hypothetical protein